MMKKHTPLLKRCVLLLCVYIISIEGTLFTNNIKGGVKMVIILGMILFPIVILLALVQIVRGSQLKKEHQIEQIVTRKLKEHYSNQKD